MAYQRKLTMTTSVGSGDTSAVHPQLTNRVAPQLSCYQTHVAWKRTRQLSDHIRRDPPQPSRPPTAKKNPRNLYQSLPHFP